MPLSLLLAFALLSASPTSSSSLSDSEIQLTITDEAEGYVRDYAFLRFHPSAEWGFDSQDGSKFNSGMARIAFPIERDGLRYLLAMNALPDGSVPSSSFSEPRFDVPLDIAVDDTGSYTLEWTYHLAPGWKAFLLDRQTGTRIKMWRETSYTFFSDETDWTDRFDIRVRHGMTASILAGSVPAIPSDLQISGGLSVFPNPTTESARFRLDLATEQAVRVAIYDVSGREVAVAHDGPLAAHHHDLALPVSDLTPGTYLVRASGDQISEVQRLTVRR